MAAPVDPFPNFVPAALTDGDQVDARFTALFVALDRSKPSGGLDAASIQDGIVVPGLTVVDPWQALTLGGAGPWSPTTLEFYKDLMGIVRIKPKGYAVFSGFSVPSGTVIATLPAGYRPGVTSYIRFLYVQVGGPSSGYGWCSVSTAGVITQGSPMSATTTFTLAFAGNFRAEN